eukprot:2619531-Rhodomonas_salina.5
MGDAPYRAAPLFPKEKRKKKRKKNGAGCTGNAWGMELTWREVSALSGDTGRASGRRTGTRLRLGERCAAKSITLPYIPGTNAGRPWRIAFDLACRCCAVLFYCARAMRCARERARQQSARRIPMGAESFICLRARYAICSTDRAYGCTDISTDTDIAYGTAICLRARYAVSGTGLAYGAMCCGTGLGAQCWMRGTETRYGGAGKRMAATTS